MTIHRLIYSQAKIMPARKRYNHACNSTFRARGCKAAVTAKFVPAAKSCG